MTLVVPIVKRFTLTLPLLFFQALLDEDLERFALVARDSKGTSWEVPGGRQPVSLPHEFVSRLTEVLRRKPLVAWLDDFGYQGRNLAPLVVGALLGQLLGGKEKAPDGQQPYTWEGLHQSLEALGYSTRDRQRMLGWAAPDLRSDMSLEEALRVVLRHATQHSYRAGEPF